MGRSNLPRNGTIDTVSQPLPGTTMNENAGGALPVRRRSSEAPRSGFRGGKKQDVAQIA
jgi:hypothetical protein